MPERRGRPRDPAVDAVLALHTLRLLAARGYDALAVSDIAAAAGISKMTLYRRYRNKRALVIAALSSIAKNAPQAAYSGSLARDLFTLGDETLVMMRNMGVFPMLSALIVRAERDPQPLKLLRKHIILPRRRVVRSLLAQAQQHGELAARLDLDVATDALIGSIFFRHNAGLTLDRRWLRSAIDHLVAAWQS